MMPMFPNALLLVASGITLFTQLYLGSTGIYNQIQQTINHLFPTNESSESLTTCLRSSDMSVNTDSPEVNARDESTQSESPSHEHMGDRNNALPGR